jgi:hypothetical protein
MLKKELEAKVKELQENAITTTSDAFDFIEEDIARKRGKECGLEIGRAVDLLTCDCFWLEEGITDTQKDTLRTLIRWLDASQEDRDSGLFDY